MATTDMVVESIEDGMMAMMAMMEYYRVFEMIEDKITMIRNIVAAELRIVWY